MLNAKLYAAKDLNLEGARAHRLDARQTLAQLAMTGTLNDTFYVDAASQLDSLLAACFDVAPSFVAKTAVYARQHGRMKDVPVVLLAWLASFDGELCAKVFDRVIDSGAQLRSFVQALRSGLVARKSLGSRPKRLVQSWLERASDETLVRAMVGNTPSLGDVIKMVHPRAASVERSALYAHAIGKEVDIDLLPRALRDLDAFKRNPRLPVPEVPFQMLTALPLTTQHWIAIARHASYTMTRMNLNTFARHGVFNEREMVKTIAARLRNERLIRQAKAFPYQLLTTWQATTNVPPQIRDALGDAVDIAVANVPALKGTIAVAVDVSGSMASPVTGYRRGATTATRCVDVAGLMAASVLAQCPGALVLPFNDSVRPWLRTASTRVIDNATALAAMLGGGTAVSAPIEALNRLGVAPDMVLIVSDNQSWIDDRNGHETATEKAWAKLKARNSQARLVCLDLQPYANTQAKSAKDVLNVGGFGDAVWEVLAAFSRGESGKTAWTQAIERVEL